MKNFIIEALISVVLANNIIYAQSGSISNELILETFKTQDFNKLGTPAWIMEGSKAIMADGKVTLTSATTTLFGESDSIKVRTGKSVFDQTTKIWTSEEKVVITSGTLWITGMGFIMDATAKTIHINQDVKVKMPTLMNIKGVKNEK
ncbi:MAG: LPS export ABC transporter periplasmic protein LptC [Lentisphaeria bacterium]